MKFPSHLDFGNRYAAMAAAGIAAVRDRRHRDS